MTTSSPAVSAYLSHRDTPCDASICSFLSRLTENIKSQFLAKLSTNLAKPRGVRVLLRRDVSSLLASTPATKIPGCGPGSLAAKQFAVLGISSILDLRRVNAAELRGRLGEQLGIKVTGSIRREKKLCRPSVRFANKIAFNNVKRL